MHSLDAAENLGAAAQEAAQITRDNTVGHWDEEDITDEFVDNLVDELNGASMKHLIAADDFSKNNPTAESAVGADFIFVVVYATEAAITDWGFLSQAKYYANAANQSSATSRLVNQCNTMQSHTPSSFANIYYEDTYRFFPASQLVADGLTNNGLSLMEMSTKFSNRATRTFFKEVFYGLWGDQWVAQYFNELLEADTSDDVPDRGVMTDGGENDSIVRGVITIIKERNVEYRVTDELGYENLNIFSDSDI
jgi:hypothetical protein